MTTRKILFKDSTALITGGGTGIGRGIALALATRGATVALCGRRPDPLAQAAGEIAARGGQAVPIAADIATASGRQNLLAAAHATCGPIHLLVHNAGILASGSLLQLKGPEIENAVATNLAAPIDLTRLFLPDLMQAHGSVVLIGSTASHVPLPYAPLYSATKGGLHAFGGALRYELEPLGVHLLEAHPPTVATAMTASMRRRAGRWQLPAMSPEAAGERIVAALEAGMDTCTWGAGERWLMRLQRHLPGLVTALLRTQRRRFARIMTPERHGAL